jgi:hypothetical protein
VVSSLPPPSSKSLVPDGYGGLVDSIGVEVRTTRLRAARAANTELVGLYWRIGRLILDRQQTEPWGSGVIKRLSTELRRGFPDMKGLSATNLQYMRAFAAAWPDTDAVSQRAVGTLPWGHVRALLDQLDDPPGRRCRRGPPGCGVAARHSVTGRPRCCRRHRRRRRIGA